MKKIYDISSLELVKFNYQPLVKNLYSTLIQAMTILGQTYSFEVDGGIAVLENQEDLLDLSSLYLAVPLSQTPLDAVWHDKKSNCWVATTCNSNDFCMEYVIPQELLDEETLNHFRAESFDGIQKPMLPLAS